MVDIMLSIVVVLCAIGLVAMVVGFQVFLYHEAYVDKHWSGTLADKWMFWCILPFTFATFVFAAAFLIDGFQQGML